MKKGLVIGKFYPPHNGHHYLIDTAIAESDTTDVLVCDHPTYAISATTRAQWLKVRHPQANIHIIPDIEKDDDSAAWAKHTREFLGYTPDIVFSSEDYGDEYARIMGAAHRKVDKERVHVPISGTKVRGDVLKNWRYLQPHVRAQYAIRVCVLGAESTGTTTLSQALARHYRTAWVPEFGRYYTESLACLDHHKWKSHDFTFIAAEQQAFENQLAGACNKLLICDTNAFATRIWHERYIGTMSQEVDMIACNDYPDLYIITNDDIPFVQDGTRDGEHIRHDMHQRFIDEVQKTKIPFILVKGTPEERLEQATHAIKPILERRITI